MNSVNDNTTVMVVDDTPANLGLLEEMLHRERYRVTAFPRGALALRAAAKSPPDLILLDVMMPDMDGFEVCRRLKADEALKDIPILFISALDDMDSKVRAFAEGGVDYVTKPFHEEEVLARVSNHLRLRLQQFEIEERKRDVQRSYERLRELEKLRDSLTQMVVHDMRSPLSAVIGNLQYLQADLAEKVPSALEVWQAGMAAAQELVTMCNALLDVSRLEAGQMPVNRESCDLHAVAVEAVRSVQAQASVEGVSVFVEGLPLPLAADKSLLERVLVNLLTNAIKHTPQGGVITVKTSAADGCARVEVHDTGCGIPAAYHQMIFEKFGQVQARQEGQKHSSGLGLAFCKLAVEAHGGKMGVQSEVGKGSVFWFTIPPQTDGA